ncbi:hypothetical protein yberc0001_27580 [Yersinia bercovieri ATCC 43970]|uniref:Uncharacterized protein n=1 Tax=Yersinia bercovieri ATCC 43970 TaxID=349968 RepID=A0ABM9XX14_YERBE|nr:hypothetical protein yberc0001_27580 [Yersinia bercovieri ATCC 43970]
MPWLITIARAQKQDSSALAMIWYYLCVNSLLIGQIDRFI